MRLFQKIKNRCFWLIRKYKKHQNLAYFKYASDKLYIKKKYKEKIGKRLNIKTPETFNEKLQWLKLYDHNPLYTTMVDKYEAHQLISECLGEDYLIPLLGVWDDPEQIDFESLPNQFVLKCTHNSGLGMYICKDKSIMDVDSVKANLRIGLEQDFYRTSREWPYKNVPRRIIAEQFMTNESSKEKCRGLDNFKFFCFNGEPKLIFVYQAQQTSDGKKPEITSCDIYDTDWNHQPFYQYCTNAEVEPAKPTNLADMIRICRIMSKGFPFLRVDFYEINGRTYVGELTLYPSAGFIPFCPEEWDYKLGSWLELPKKKWR